MARNKLLSTVVSRLSHSYVLLWLSDDILIVKEASDHPILAQLFVPKEVGQLLVSISVNYPNSPGVAKFIYDLFHVTSFSMSDPFYESTFNGQMSYGEEAYKTNEIENSINILQAVPCINENPI